MRIFVVNFVPYKRIESMNVRGVRWRKDAHFFHVYTKGLEDDVIFKERTDYIVGMNYVPVAFEMSGVDILAFVLMSNHFHFVVYCEEYQANHFIDIYKRLISRYIRNKYGTRKLLRAVKTSCAKIDIDDEALKRLIAYVMNNPVKAGVNCLPQNYEWGSGFCYFSNYDFLKETVALACFGVREQIRILKTSCKLDGCMRINSSFYIDPRSYVNVGFVESLFGRAKSLEYFLSVSNRGGSVKGDGPMTFSDTLVMKGVQEILDKKYESLQVGELTANVRRKLIQDVRKQFNSSPKQLARVLGIRLNEVVEALNIG